MSRRRILNITSRKKQDTMLTWSNTTAANPTNGATYASVPAVLVGGQTYVFPWCATARDNDLVAGTEGNIFDTATRTATECYMVGLKERVQIQTNSGMPWQWRRICFTIKGNDLPAATTATMKLFAETSAGIQRLLNNVQTSALNGVINNLVFKGTDGGDWNNYFNAKTDTRRVTIMYDKTTSIRSGNTNGIMREYKRWHRMGKMLVYDDEEAGGGVSPDYLSTVGRRGMGDYYVLDIISAGSGSTSSDVMTVNPQSTLYWHER